MPDERNSRAPVDDPPYRVYRSGGRSGPQAPPKSGQRSAREGSGRSKSGPRDRARASGGGAPPYRTYRGRSRILNALLGRQDELELPREDSPRRTRSPWRRRTRTGPRKKITPGRVFKWLVLAVVAWLLLSLVLFMVSAGTQSVPLPASASKALTPGGNMITSADTILILGTDQRPRTGPGSKEPGSNYNVAGSHSDTIMLWRVGGGVSRRLSIPRDTVAQIPGHGVGKINAGFAIGGPALAIKTVEHFTGIKINHVIVVNLARFPPFIDSIGGIDVKTEHVCANISGGKKNGGFTLNLKPGVHHFNGLQALIYARGRTHATRRTATSPASSTSRRS